MLPGRCSAQASRVLLEFPSFSCIAATASSARRARSARRAPMPRPPPAVRAPRRATHPAAHRSRSSASIRSSRASTRRASSIRPILAGETSRGCAGIRELRASEISGRPRPQAEERVVEAGEQPVAILVQDRLDERAPDHLARPGVAVSPRASARRPLDERLASWPVSPTSTAARIAAAQSPSDAAEQRGERLAQPLRAERLVLEQRQLPALERLAELGVVLGLGELGRADRRRASRATGRAGSARRPARSRRSRSSAATPNGWRSSRSKTTGPAATGAPVASRSAVTASASSAGASGGVVLPGRAARARGRATHVRSGSLPKPGGSSSRASGHRAVSSSSVVARTRIPRASSIVTPTERPTSGAAARYKRVVPNSELLQLAVDPVERAVLPVEAAAGLGGAGEQSAAGSCGRARGPRSRPRPACAARKDRARPARGSARRARSGRPRAARAT